MQSGRVWQLRWLDRVFQGEHLPNFSIKYVAINKDLKNYDHSCIIDKDENLLW